MNNHVRISFLTVLVCLFCCSLAFAQTATPRDQSDGPMVTATALNDRVRFVSAGEVHVTRLQAFSRNGAQVFDSGVKLGNLIDWKLCDQQGASLSSGSYVYLVTIKDFSDRATQRYGTAQIEADQVYLERSTMDLLPVAQTAALETNRQAEVISPIDRMGVAAMNRIVGASTGSERNGSGNNRTADETANGAPDVRPEVAGTGTQNFLSKWTDNTGTLGDSPVFSSADRIGIGTFSPGAKFHVVGTQGSIGAGSFQLDTSTTFPAFTAAYPAFEVVNTNQTNNNVSLFQFADAPSGASHAGIGAVNTSHPNKFGDLFFYTKQPADGYQIRMGIFGSNVGIGTISPTAVLNVVGSQPRPVSSFVGTNATSVVSVIGGKGGESTSIAGNGGRGAEALIQAGNGGNSNASGIGGDGGSVTLQAGTGGGGPGLSGFGGFIRLRGGDATEGQPNGPGGSILIQPGKASAPYPDGNVGIGEGIWNVLFPPEFKLHVIDSGHTGLRVQTNAAGGTVASFGGNGIFQIDAPGFAGGRLTVLENGNVGIGTAVPPDKLYVVGNIVSALAAGGSTQVCQNNLAQYSTCGSSLRYKQNISPFDSGLNLVKRLSPITFNWKQGGMKDLGLGAEDVEKVDPLLVTYNAKGEVEGVKYDRVAVVLINAVKEQQKEIETLRDANRTLNARLRVVEKRFRKFGRRRS
ncbi:MAG TPA: tail fiber domain-containing protein [Pyrinomonadaceae bacterium]|nr:tail fiber domain-containing protein [Pyrinomonadaceae bacterium]